MKQQSSLENIRTLLSDQPTLLCSCTTCSTARQAAGIKPGAKPTLEKLESFFENMDDDDFRGHYVQSRFQESRQIGKSEARQLSAQLAKLYDASTKLKLDNYRLPYRHLKNWLDALSAP